MQFQAGHRRDLNRFHLQKNERIIIMLLQGMPSKTGKLFANKRLQVAYTHAHAYMWAPVPQGNRRFLGVLYIPDVTISYVTKIVGECLVTYQSYCLELEVKVSGGVVTDNGFLPSSKIASMQA